MILTAQAITATDALTIGLVNKISPGEELLQKAKELMDKILLNAPLAVAAAIKAANAAGSFTGYETEINGFANCFGTADTKEGTEAFLQKRKPVFQGK